MLSSHSNDRRSGGLTVDAKTYLTYAIENAGLSSIDRDVYVDFYLDDSFVRRLGRWEGMAAGGTGSNATWDELDATVRIAPGPHAVRLVIDPTNVVHESDETDNVFEAVFSWGVDAPPRPPDPAPARLPPEPTPYVPLKLPNLKPFTLYGWDAPLTARPGGSSEKGRDLPLLTTEDAIISFTFENASPVGPGSPFEAKVYLDGRLVDTSGFESRASTVGGWYWTSDVKIPAGEVSAGTHTVAFVIDSDDRVEESDESDNVFSRTFDWFADSPQAPLPVSHSSPELRQMLAPLMESLIFETETVAWSARNGVDWLPAILQVAEAGYYLATGRSIRDERLAVEFLPRAAYERATFDSCMRRAVELTRPEYMDRSQMCTELIDKNSGLKTRSDGMVKLFVDIDDTPVGTLNTLFHELGHALQDFMNPDLTEAYESPHVKALHEAQAQTFEAVVWRRIEDFLDADLRSYPDVPSYAKRLEWRFDQRLDDAADDDEHAVGYLLMWLNAVLDPQDMGLLEEMSAAGRLSWESSLAVYEYLVSIGPNETAAWVDQLIRRDDLAELVRQYRDIARARLTPGLHPDQEAHPDIFDAAILSP